MAETSILLRTAQALYRVDNEVKRKVHSDYGSLSPSSRHHYEIMARAALVLILAEPVSVETPSKWN